MASRIEDLRAALAEAEWRGQTDRAEALKEQIARLADSSSTERQQHATRVLERPAAR